MFILRGFVKTKTFISAIASSLIVLAIIVLAFVLVFKRKKNQRSVTGEIKSEDLNPVYGMYYFSDGERIDESQSEVADGNEYYAS